jgi:hypothetical protein
MSGRSSEVIHTNINQADKIEISPDGNYAFFGGKGLHVLDLTDGDYKLIRNDVDARINFNSIKVLKSNRVLIVEPNTNSLKVYNRKFDRLLKIQGNRGDAFRKIPILPIF